MPRPKSATVSEHIFPASELRPLAIRWKELNAAGRHSEAMPILEEIVAKSTDMFIRLAQHEGYHYTVDLNLLVSAAQQKIVTWLLKWVPRKGALFSWFSLHGNTYIQLADGTSKTIKELVDTKYSGKVVCWNTRKNAFEHKKVVGWSKTPANRKEWLKLRVIKSSGYSHPVYLTREHRVLTQTGWIPADWLNPRDVLFVNCPELTKQGQEAVLGLYLGDGSILRHDFRVTHGKDQRFYNDYLTSKFRAFVYVAEEGRRYWNKFTRKIQDHSGESTIIVRALEMWKDFDKLAHPKKVDEWLTSRVTDVSLAFWYMDDGSYQETNGAVTIATHGFRSEYCRILVDMLRDRFGVESKYYKNTGGIYIPARGRDAFFRRIAPYVLKDFNYKLPKAYRSIAKKEIDFVRDVLVPVNHEDIAGPDQMSWKLVRVFKPRRCEMETFGTFKWKYDLTVQGHPNFFAGRCKLLVHNSKCAKNSFRSELAKVNQFRERYHVTSDNLEKIYGTEDHTIDKKDCAAELEESIKQISCRWGDPQEIGAIRYLIDCVVEEEHDKQASIRSAAYAWGISIDLAKFFYIWALTGLRDIMYRKIRVAFTEQDLFLLVNSYETFTNLYTHQNTLFTWEHIMYMMCVYGGLRIKVPTIAAFYKAVEDHKVFKEIDNSDKDPDSVAEIAKKHGRTARSAQETYNDMVQALNPQRAGEYDVYDNESESGV